MRANVASRTARAVALARALATSGHGRVRIDDPFAKKMLTRVGFRIAQLAAATPSLVKLGTNAMSMGLIEHLALRTRAIDEAVVNAVERGATQVVILGAGLDTRAHRLPLGACRVFEVDHPATQAVKIQRASALPRRCHSLVYVPVDFVATRFEDALREHGFDPRERSVWIWEGVTMYLPDHVVRSSVEHIAANASPGSVVALSYVQRSEEGAMAHLLRAGAALLHAIGEPLHAEYSAGEMHALLQSAGFLVRADDCDESWLRAEGKRPVFTDALRAEHVVIAVRQS